jgi:hypothetical protein
MIFLLTKGTIWLPHVGGLLGLQTSVSAKTIRVFDDAPMMLPNKAGIDIGTQVLINL